MTGANPIVTTTPPASTSSASQTSSLSDLGPNAFITLLTAQLQAQDPDNPLDPNQMVDELTSMNTLQQTIQIRQDLDSLVAATQGSSTSTTGSGTTGAAPTANISPAAANAIKSAYASLANPAPPAAAAAMSTGLAALVKSMGSASTSNPLARANSTSKLF